MKIKSLFLVVTPTFFGCSIATAQINFGDKALEALQKGVTGLTFSDAQAAQLSKDAVIKMDAEHTIAGLPDPYIIRFNKIFGEYSNAYGLALN